MHSLRIKIKDELLPLVLLVLALIIIIAIFPSNILRIILGLPFVLFFPGYTLMAALYPRRERISGMERVALSFGLSLAIVPLIGLILNFTPWGIRLEPILYSVASFIVIMAVFAWFSRKRLIADERFKIEFSLTFPGWGSSVRDRTLSIIIVLAALVILGVAGYFIATPKTSSPYTEFYILNLDSKAVDYPTSLKIGEAGKVIIGIVNHESKTVDYRVEVRIGGVKSNEIGPIVLENGKKREQETNFIPQVAGNQQKVEFILYKNTEVELALEQLNL
jgi:uncharacterized membrane protein